MLDHCLNEDCHCQQIRDQRDKAEGEAAHYKELLKLATPILDAVDDAAHRVRFTELHKIS